MLGFLRVQWYGFLDGLDVSIDEADIRIPPLLNSLDTFAESIFVLLSLLQLWE